MNGRGLWACWAVCFVVFLAQPPLTSQLPDVIKIGGLFDVGDVNQKLSFQSAFESVNAGLRRTSFQPIIREIPPGDSFHASKKVCSYVRAGVAAIFGPQSERASAHVQSICDALEIPHIETRWDYRARREHYSINLYPHPFSLSKAYFDLVREFEWTSFTILYEDNDGLVRLQELFKVPPKKYKITLLQLPDHRDYRDVLRKVLISSEYNLILDCKTENVERVLKQAQQVGLMTALHSFLITSLDLHLVDLQDFKYSGTNITAVRLVDPERGEARKFMYEWRMKVRPRVCTLFPTFKSQAPAFPQTEAMLMYDAVKLYVMAIQALDNSTYVQITPLKCELEGGWIHGNSLINYMKMVRQATNLGKIKFLKTRSSRRASPPPPPPRGQTATTVYESNCNPHKPKDSIPNALSNSPRHHLTRLLLPSRRQNDPYIMLRESSERLSGNDRFEGFCIDLLNEIAEILKFNFVLIPIKAYGSRNATTGEWNGMIKELLEDRGDMAVTDLTINFEREDAVDFTMPFMNLGISILYKKPQKMAPSLFSFLSPLSIEVWIYMITAYVGVSIVMYILARFSPYEWQNPHPCDPDPDTLENQFTILNCLWFAIGSLMQQGCDFLPQAVSTRMVAGMWWFFTLIMISSYTANLAAFLTVERMESPIESADDLAKQTKIKYGLKEGGTTSVFFRDSKIPTYKHMWDTMNKYKEMGENVFTGSNKEGATRVSKSNGLYAFFMESTTIEYVIERECDLTQVGGLLDSKSYGIALQPGSPYKGVLDVAILTLQSRGRFHTLKEKWFRQKRGGGKCKEEAGGSSMASELNLPNVGGVFVVLIGGMGLALVVALGEFVLYCWEISREDEKSLISVLSEELCFVFQCKGSTKPVRKKAESETAAVDNMYGSDVYNCSGRNPLT
ncbi:glutamate receptor ionotropic, kainate 2-like [Penaeus chinensis]|uniref:glutamate receptor ionotropic, kainate 2-like n=1 Tax=Penaeus chinensis TaxID=139456 RepID=UPI001FB5BE9E|nr:glutamate receptor ionotropic, kainate 2-like [Penaeus chinensis]